MNRCRFVKVRIGKADCEIRSFSYYDPEVDIVEVITDRPYCVSNPSLSIDSTGREGVLSFFDLSAGMEFENVEVLNFKSKSIVVPDLSLPESVVIENAQVRFYGRSNKIYKHSKCYVNPEYTIAHIKLKESGRLRYFRLCEHFIAEVNCNGILCGFRITGIQDDPGNIKSNQWRAKMGLPVYSRPSQVR